MSSIVFTLLFGMLSGIAGFLGSSGMFEIILGLGLIGLSHYSLLAARKSEELSSARNHR
jgi:hypothetical protein